MGMPPPPPASMFKKKNLPSAKEVVELQEAIVKELESFKGLIEATLETESYHAETLVAFVQACASGVVEKRYGHSSDCLTLAGFKHGMVLGKDERFVQASMAQQNALIAIAQLVPEGAEGSNAQGCCLM